MRHNEETFKIQPFELLTKIQDAKPLHLSNMINKELGYDVIVEIDEDQSMTTISPSLLQSKAMQSSILSSSVHLHTHQNQTMSSQGTLQMNTSLLGAHHHSQTQSSPTTEKIKSCICSVRPNSEIFKRLSKAMLNNVRLGINQLYLFCSHPSEYQSRLESSIGVKSNPGLFIIAAISLLNQKYNHGTGSIGGVSSGTEMGGTSNFSGTMGGGGNTAMMAQISSFNYDIEVSFTQLIDNNVYDLLNYTGEPLKFDRQYKVLEGQSFVKISTFKQFIKLFKIALFNNKERDFKTGKGGAQISRPKSTFFMKIRSKLYTSKGDLCYSQETVFIDYEVSMTKTSPSSYNSMVPSSAKSTWDYILMDLNNSNPSNKKMHYHLVDQNYLLMLFQKYLVNGQVTFVNSISANSKKLKDNLEFLSSIREHAGSLWDPKPIPVSFSLLTHSRLSIASSFIKRGSMVLDWQKFDNKTNKILREIQQKHYSSIRQLQGLKLNCTQVIKKLNYWVKSYKAILIRLMSMRRNWKFCQNTNIADQIMLIGSCVKSDHFKDFYNAKSYLSLEREVSIKTQITRTELKDHAKSYSQALDKFRELKSKQQDSIAAIIIKNQEEGSLAQKVSKTIEEMLSYFHSMEQELITIEERTIADEILREESFLEQIQRVNQFWKDFSEKLIEVGSNKAPISCEQENIVLAGSYFSLLKEMKTRTFGQLGLNTKNKLDKQAATKPPKKAFTKLPELSTKSSQIKSENVIRLSSLKLQSLLINPNEETKI